jgi:hypothetical protein
MLDISYTEMNSYSHPTKTQNLKPLPYLSVTEKRIIGVGSHI